MASNQKQTSKKSSAPTKNSSSNVANIASTNNNSGQVIKFFCSFTNTIAGKIVLDCTMLCHSIDKKMVIAITSVTIGCHCYCHYLHQYQHKFICLSYIITLIYIYIEDVLANRSGWKEVNENEGKAYIAFK